MNFVDTAKSMRQHFADAEDELMGIAGVLIEAAEEDPAMTNKIYGLFESSLFMNNLHKAVDFLEAAEADLNNFVDENFPAQPAYYRARKRGVPRSSRSTRRRSRR